MSPKWALTGSGSASGPCARIWGKKEQSKNEIISHIVDNEKKFKHFEFIHYVYTVPVLRHRLHHEHPLLPEVGEDLWHVRLQVVRQAVEEDVAKDRHAGPEIEEGKIWNIVQAMKF